MATVESPELRNRIVEERVSTGVATGGSTFEALAGVAVVILAIVGLANVLPVYLTGIASIVLGAGLLCEASANVGRFARLVEEMPGTRLSDAELGGGMTAEFLGGVAGIVLGVLALVLSPYSWVLLPVAAIVFGAAFLVGSGATANLNGLVAERSFGSNEVVRRMSAAGMSAAAGIQACIGLAAVVLGIMAIAGIHVVALTLIAFLCLGCSAILSGAALSTRMFTLLRRNWVH